MRIGLPVCTRPKLTRLANLIVHSIIKVPRRLTTLTESHCSGNPASCVNFHGRPFYGVHGPYYFFLTFWLAWVEMGGLHKKW
jgi:hypothetical protein